MSAELENLCGTATARCTDSGYAESVIGAARAHGYDDVQ
jgi:hypothetical protein